MIFWTKFTQKGYSSFKSEKVNITIEFCIFKLVSVANFKLKLLTILTFWTKFTQIGYLRSKSEKVNITIEFCIFELFYNQFHRVNFRYSVSYCIGTKFQNKLTILAFWTKFAQKEYFWSKAEKVNTTIRFCIFELV